MNILNKIKELKKQRNAIILAHNYQIPEVQDISDFVGDSLELSQAASKTSANVIVFCGVHFMAETASILSPDKKVLLPDLRATCSLAEMVTADDLREWRKIHPDSLIVSYINTTAEVKAESDYCCTSSNALKVIDSIPREKEILFVPDMFLGSYVVTKLNRKMNVWPGDCYVHSPIKHEDIIDLQKKHPRAEFLIHPECGCVSQIMYLMAKHKIPSKEIHILSTGGMVKQSLRSSTKEFVIATEIGLLYRLLKENPGKTFYPASDSAECRYMKKITLDKVYKSLRDLVYEVKVEEDIAKKARRAINKMVSVT
jgi:quinolinate synthase